MGPSCDSQNEEACTVFSLIGQFSLRLVIYAFSPTAAKITGFDGFIMWSRLLLYFVTPNQEIMNVVLFFYMSSWLLKNIFSDTSVLPVSWFYASV